MDLEALIFDVDGTLANTEKDGHLQAFNMAFEQMGLDWFWSNEMYHHLLSVTGGKERIKFYLDSYKEDFYHDNLDSFISEIHKQKTNNYVELISNGLVPLRVGVKRLIDEAMSQKLRLAIATTTTPANVDALITSTLGQEYMSSFEVIGAGDVVPKKKPAADIYNYVLDKMNLEPCQTLAIEDSRNGLLSASSAGIESVLTVNEYTNEDNLDKALVVLDHLGDKDNKFSLISGDATKRTLVDIEYLRELHAKNC